MPRVEEAPALPHPFAAVFVRSDPQASTPTVFAHATTSSPGSSSRSSFVIVPTPTASASVALTGALSVTLNVSADSNTVSPRIGTVTG